MKTVLNQYIEKANLTQSAENLRKAADMAKDPRIAASLRRDAKAREIARDNFSQFDSLKDALDYGDWAVSQLKEV